MKLLKTPCTALFALLLVTACTETPVINHPIQQPIAITQPPKIVQPISSSPVITGTPISTRASSIELHPSDFNVLAGWETEDHAAAFRAFQHSCTHWRKMSGSKSLSGTFYLGTVSDWQQICSKPWTRGQERQFFEQWFKPYVVVENGDFKGLFTGYYLPELHGSNQQSARYNVPIYHIPPNGALRSKSRAAIKAGALANKGLEILWVDNEIDAYFMEVQGSGRVLMEDGSVRGLGFAGGNGHDYYAIGKTLVDNGEIARADISMQSIRTWIEQHPSEGEQLMLSNPSYVFFRPTPANPNVGPTGAMAEPLTAQHSLAIDRKHLPMGIPIWIDVEHPEQQGRLQRLVMAQDTGGAIKGAIRGDVYWGQGEKASKLAGPMKSHGFYFLLVPRTL